MSGKRKSRELEHFSPTLELRKKVSVRNLVLDANNPRFTASVEDRVPPEKITNVATAEQVREKMEGGKKDKYRIKELMDSIRQNGWQPVDAIFVQECAHLPGHFTVLEGNRRVTAILKLLKDPKLDADLAKALEHLDVWEIVSSGKPADVVQNQITYLLGVRHHGSLKRWSAYAQAADIFQRYLEITGTTADTFKWDESAGARVAGALSIPLDSVKKRMQVFIAMGNLRQHPAVKSGGRVADRHYSLIEEALKHEELKTVLPRDPQTFALSEEAAGLFVKLCRFDRPVRKPAPIETPAEWRSLVRIYEEQDAIKQAEMKEQVLTQGGSATKVWAQRSAELTTVTWASWLEQLSLKLNKIEIRDLNESEESIAAVTKLRDLVGRLQARETKETK